MEVIVNGVAVPVAAGAMLGSLIEQIGLSGKPVAVEVNQVVVPRSKHGDHALAPSDRVEIVTLVGGG